METKIRRGWGGEETNPRIPVGNAGAIDAIGDAVTQFKTGDEIYYAGYLARRSSNAEFQLVDERVVGRKPRALFCRGCGVPLTTVAAWEALLNEVAAHAKVESGRTTGKLVLSDWAD